MALVPAVMERPPFSIKVEVPDVPQSSALTPIGPQMPNIKTEPGDPLPVSTCIPLQMPNLSNDIEVKRENSSPVFDHLRPFQEVESLSSHEAGISDRVDFKRFSCKAAECPFSTDNYHSLKQHRTYHQVFHKFKGHLKCSYCSFCCNSQTTLTWHLFQHLEVQNCRQQTSKRGKGSSFKCQYCFLKCDSRRALSLHLKQHKKTTEVKLLRKTYKNKGWKTRLKKYIAKCMKFGSKSKKKYFKCPKCPFKSDEEGRICFTIHIVQHMSLSGEKCAFCTYSGLVLQIKSHELVHLRRKPMFRCYICYHKLREESTLRDHLELEHSIKLGRLKVVLNKHLQPCSEAAMRVMPPKSNVLLEMQMSDEPPALKVSNYPPELQVSRNPPNLKSMITGDQEMMDHLQQSKQVVSDYVRKPSTDPGREQLITLNNNNKVITEAMEVDNQEADGILTVVYKDINSDFIKEASHHSSLHKYSSIYDGSRSYCPDKPVQPLCRSASDDDSRDSIKAVICKNEHYANLVERNFPYLDLTTETSQSQLFFVNSTVRAENSSQSTTNYQGPSSNGLMPSAKLHSESQVKVHNTCHKDLERKTNEQTKNIPSITVTITAGNSDADLIKSAVVSQILRTLGHCSAQRENAVLESYENDNNPKNNASDIVTHDNETCESVIEMRGEGGNNHNCRASKTMGNRDNGSCDRPVSESDLRAHKKDENNRIVTAPEIECLDKPPGKSTEVCDEDKNNEKKSTLETAYHENGSGDKPADESVIIHNKQENNRETSDSETAGHENKSCNILVGESIMKEVEIDQEKNIPETANCTNKSWDKPTDGSVMEVDIHDIENKLSNEDGLISGFVQDASVESEESPPIDIESQESLVLSIKEKTPLYQVGIFEEIVESGETEVSNIVVEPNVVEKTPADDDCSSQSKPNVMSNSPSIKEKTIPLHVERSVECQVYAPSQQKNVNSLISTVSEAPVKNGLVRKIVSALEKRLQNGVSSEVLPQINDRSKASDGIARGSIYGDKDIVNTPLKGSGQMGPFKDNTSSDTMLQESVEYRELQNILSNEAMDVSFVSNCNHIVEKVNEERCPQNYTSSEAMEITTAPSQISDGNGESSVERRTEFKYYGQKTSSPSIKRNSPSQGTESGPPSEQMDCLEAPVAPSQDDDVSSCLPPNEAMPSSSVTVTQPSTSDTESSKSSLNIEDISMSNVQNLDEVVCEEVRLENGETVYLVCVQNGGQMPESQGKTDANETDVYVDIDDIGATYEIVQDGGEGNEVVDEAAFSAIVSGDVNLNDETTIVEACEDSRKEESVCTEQNISPTSDPETTCQPQNTPDETLPGDGTTANNLPSEATDKTTGEVLLQCTYCPSKFLEEALLKGHVALHRTAKGLKCPLCTYKTSKTLILKHLLCHSVTVGPDYLCPLCDTKKRTQENLHDHMKVVHSRSIYETHASVCKLKSYFKCTGCC